MPIAVQATPREILDRGQPAVLLSNDVIDLERRRVERLRNPTIVAPIRGDLRDCRR